jgi:antitoxin PrlF
MYSTKVTAKNQTTIPERIREFFGMKPGERIGWITEGDKVILRAKRRYDNEKKHLQGIKIASD